MTDPPQIRVPWPLHFPDVIVHTDVRARDAHPQYLAAKSGDADAALTLALDLLDHQSIAQLNQVIGDRAALFLPVIAEEQAGFNAIPDAMAQVVSRKLRQPVIVGEIVQINKVGHTRAKAFQRLVTPAAFDGDVQRDANYVLIDDHVGLGGTLANLRGFLESRGGRVIAMTTLTESRAARHISLRPITLDMLRERHGDTLDQLWESQFGYRIDCLTEVEAQILGREQSLVAIENFLAQGAIEARRRGFDPALGQG